MNKPLVDLPDRRFQLWAFDVSMSRLLLRSTADVANVTRIDVLFQSVKAICLTSILDGLIVSEAEGEWEHHIERTAGYIKDQNLRIFDVRSSDFHGFVVAGVAVTSEDDRPYFEPSILWPGMPGLGSGSRNWPEGEHSG